MTGKLESYDGSCIIGFDAEWTKNYKIKNSNIPFCFSVVSIPLRKITLNHLVEGSLVFDYVQYYCENGDDICHLILEADAVINNILDNPEDTVLCGHQLPSDFSVFLNIAPVYGIDNINSIKRVVDMWRNRKANGSLFDTRYDINKSFLGKSRRLVDVCSDFNMLVTQPELGKESMTKLQNRYFNTGDIVIREKLSVLNLRHSLSSIILRWLNEFLDDEPSSEQININDCLHAVLSDDFTWVNSQSFRELLTP